MRPKSSKDTKKRKTRTRWSSEEMRFLRDHYHDMTLGELSKHLKRPKASISIVAKEMGYCKLGTYHPILLEEAVINCDYAGVYLIGNDVDDMIYIGYSDNIAARIKKHISDLKRCHHKNSFLQEYWKKDCIFHLSIIKQCDAIEAAKLECDLIRGLDSRRLLNVTRYNSHPIMSLKEKDRFWKRVNKQSNGCWIWTGWIEKGGYGQIKNNNKQYAAHRVAYFLIKGRFHIGLKLLHSCDVKICCNPDHLILGTDKDNMIDYYSKFSRKFDKQTIIEIQKLRNNDTTLDDLARQFNTSRSYICRLLKKIVN